ncbi:MAG: response regulator transcription factor [Arachnia sp.]
MENLTTRTRVLLADDETLVRSGLRMILEGDSSIEVVGEATNGASACTLVTSTQPEVVLMDIRMPHMDGLAATQQILAENPHVKIIVLTSFDVDDLVPRALRLGARGYLLKDTPPRELIDAVHRVAAGDTILSQTALTHLVEAVVRQQPSQNHPAGSHPLDMLSEREIDVARAIARGLTNGQIATELFISITTVKTHVGRILEKLQVANRVQIAAHMQRRDI